MKDRKTMTKSLHTITVVRDVAAFIYNLPASARPGLKLDGTAQDAVRLARMALSVLGYEYNLKVAMHEDDTLCRCVDAVQKFLDDPKA